MTREVVLRPSETNKPAPACLTRRVFVFASCSALAIPASVAPAMPACAACRNDGLEFLGVNLSGAEFGKTNVWNEDGSGVVQTGVYGRDYTYPTSEEIDYFAQQGFNVARVPFLLERMQPEPFGALDGTEIGLMDTIVSHAAKRGMTILLDPHNYGFMWAHPIGETEASDVAFANFWENLAAHYAAVPNVIFGLMNEPYLQSPSAWARSCNKAIEAIRRAETGGVTHQINAPGTYHENGHSYVRQHNADRFAEAIIDPENRIVFEIHQYNDPDESGSDTAPRSANVGPERLRDVTAWARAKDFRLFLGEFGGLNNPEGLKAVDNLLKFLVANSDVWQGATQWAAGPWWPADFSYRLEPLNGVPSPQLEQLARYNTRNRDLQSSTNCREKG